MQSVFVAMTLLAACHSIPTTNKCPHQHDLPTWKEHSGTFSPVSDGTSHHLNRLKLKMASLVFIIKQGGFKKKDNTQLDKYLKHYGYNDIFSAEYFTAPGESSLFSQAYEKFQLLYLAIEVVKNDHRHHEVALDIKVFWDDISELLLSITKNTYTELVMQGAEPSSELGGSRIPGYLSCLEHSAYRDTRDFVILRHLLTTLQATLEILDV